MIEEKATETPQKEDAYFPKSVKEAVAYLRERGELDEEKWTQLKRKSLQVKLLVIVVAIAASLTAWQLGWGMAAYLPPVIAIVLLIMHHRDEQHKVLIATYSNPLEMNITSSDKELNCYVGGMAYRIKYDYFINNQTVGPFIKSVPANNIFKDIKVLCNPLDTRKHILISSNQPNSLYQFNLRKEN